MASTYNIASMGPSGAVPSEQKLIRFSQNGDQDAFAYLYETHLDQIYRYIYFRVYERELAEDLTSVVFLKVWEHLGSFKSGSVPFLGWVYRIAHNTVIDHYRTRKTTVPLEDVHPRQLSLSDGVDDKLDMEILSLQLREALQEVTSTQREVLILRFIWGLTTTEIADTLKKGRGAIRALQMRGLKRMARNPAIRKGRIRIYER